MSTKLMDNNRRAHAAKVLAKSSKKNQESDSHASDVEIDQRDVEVEQPDSDKGILRSEELNSLNDQYQVIREDILKLREDLAHGYDLLKEYVETKLSIRTLLKTAK